MKIAVIGLGNMGAAIATKLLSTEQVVGVELSAERREEWSHHTGSPAVSSLDDLDWHTLEHLIIAVRTSASALAIVQKLPEHTTGALACHVVTTLEHSDAVQLGELGLPEAIRVLEQPISGGATGAASGSLTVLSAGPALEQDDAFLLGHLAQHVIHFSEYGQPTMTKLVNNTTAALNLGAHVWALEVAASHGIDATRMRDILQMSSGGSAIAEFASHMKPDQGQLLDKDVELLVSAIGERPTITMTVGASLAALRRVHELTMER